VLALPWRTYDLAHADVANFLAVTLYSVELFQPGPQIDVAQVELSLVRGESRVSRTLPVRSGAPADRWYYSVEAAAYYPEWSPPGPDDLWHAEVALLPGAPVRMQVPLPRDISHGYQAFAAPMTAGDRRAAGQARLDVRLLTMEGFAAEAMARNAAADEPLVPPAGRLARLAAQYVAERFAACASEFRFCAATTLEPWVPRRSPVSPAGGPPD
jgi:hypothetical protein